MIDWNPSEIEAVIGCRFDVPDQKEPFQFHEAFFELGGVGYCLNICPATEQVWLRADMANPNQATPHFEFVFRCDRIRTGAGGYNSRAIYFDFSAGDVEVDSPAHCRLVMDRLPNGNLYIWPIVGASDPAIDFDHLRTRPTRGEQNHSSEPGLGVPLPVVTLSGPGH